MFNSGKKNSCDKKKFLNEKTHSNVLFFVFISNKFSSHCGSVIFTIFTNNKTYEYSFDAIDLLKIKITDREILASLKKAINSHQSKSSFDIVNLLL
jgi:uncharacterized protein YkuJ